jgi:hypothetical protein
MSSSSEDETCIADNILDVPGFWCTKKRSAPIKEFVIINYEKTVPVDFVRITASQKGASIFPSSFRIEGSMNAEEWTLLYSESNTSLEINNYEIPIPLTLIKYLKLVITEPAVSGSQYFSEIGLLEAGISGALDISASSWSSANNGENILVSDNRLCWESELKANSSNEFINIDLGKICSINRILLASSTEGFPENFHVETSIDSEVWTTIFYEKGFEAENSKKYYWDTGIVSARYVRLETAGRQFVNRKFGVRIAEMGVYSAIASNDHTHNIGDITPHASVFNAGMVKLARDGESVPGAVVQSSDSRLRDASTVFKGIVRFANHGESLPGLAVQSDDSRLQPASEGKPGVVRLAYNRESKPNAVVQSNDSRLQHAGEDNFGIVKICPDGEYKENSVVSGNDSRIHRATTDSHGICILALDGGDSQGTVVQGNDRRLKDATRISKGIIRIAEDGESADDAVPSASDRRLRDATTGSKGIVELAEDGEDIPGVAVQGNDRRLKDATTGSRGIVELAEDGEDRPGVAVQGNDRRFKDATTDNSGIVELAEDGEDIPGVAVQGNDRRLKDATETAKGIIKFASDGGEEPLSAVQGNDKRLRKATTSTCGIVELAEDGEDRAQVVVQGNDKRIKDATTSSKGIVELAEDGEDKAGVAVQGNDRRLKDATTDNKGIVELAEDGEDRAEVAVQGNDKRLKDATETAKGIMKFASDGGEESLSAVQGNDRRLKKATTLSSGIVELAEDGEDSPGVVVQGNDKRLKYATEEMPGIVRFGRNGESVSKTAVQADDSRLSDSREPLPHEHDYAPLDHSYSSHKGTIVIRDSRDEAFKDITPPSDGSSVIYGNNISESGAAIGVTGIAANSRGSSGSYGMVGHSTHVGMRGQSSGRDGNGAGVIGVCRFGAGGVFSSEHGYSLIADGSGKLIGDFDGNLNLMGDGKALLVKGDAEFHGRLIIKGGNEAGDFPAGFVEFFEVDEVEYVSPGDILVVSEAGGGILSKSRKSYSTSVIGIVSGNPYISVNNSGKEEKIYPIALSGKVLCKVDARNKPVNPGDLIVASDVAGCGMAGRIDSFDKIGSVLGKALDRLDDGVDLIPVFITHQ